MPKPSQQQTTEEAPLYIRWNPDRAPYAVELKLELISRLNGELNEAERLGIEIGGMLLGSLPNPEVPTLRIDDVAIISRRFEDGAIYMLEPGQQQRFAEIRAAAKVQNRVPAGFFRSHLRPGPLQPSLADRTLLSEQFANGVYALLLIQSRAPRTAAFFLSGNGQLTDQPSVRKFFFDESEFKYLPEVAGDALDGKEAYPFMEPRGASYRWIAVLGLTVLAALLLLGIFSGEIVRTFRPPSNKLDLAATSAGDELKISWDHGASPLEHARGALIVIDDGDSHREVRLDPDELRLGEVDYERLTKKVAVTMTIDSPGSALPPQTLEWNGQ
jgi:hypothetical protein